jgi:hypothetical protein
MHRGSPAEDLVRHHEQDILDFHDALAPLLSYSLIRLELNEGNTRAIIPRDLACQP